MIHDYLFINVQNITATFKNLHIENSKNYKQKVILFSSTLTVCQCAAE